MSYKYRNCTYLHVAKYIFKSAKIIYNGFVFVTDILLEQFEVHDWTGILYRAPQNNSKVTFIVSLTGILVDPMPLNHLKRSGFFTYHHFKVSHSIVLINHNIITYVLDIQSEHNYVSYKRYIKYQLRVLSIILAIIRLYPTY